ncbi:hypothetical protein Anas_12559 [Armadillidium nasatum]|uniref:Uncharacterized protein n=1 Tax=Armadillidium nasatum TaxID=96803 RepID=A0A5N5T0C0_9CRUS|nr:hypothetical protein Anas_12559 [Armadillidium nasatum]
MQIFLEFSFLYGYNRILYVNDIPAITAILESFPVHDCTLSFRESKTQLLQTNWKPKGLDPNYQLRVTDIPTHPLPSTTGLTEVTYRTAAPRGILTI